MECVTKCVSTLGVVTIIIDVTMSFDIAAYNLFCSQIQRCHISQNKHLISPIACNNKPKKCDIITKSRFCEMTKCEWIPPGDEVNCP